MLLRSLLSLPVVCLAIGTLSAANDPFIGKWDSESAKVKTGIELQIQPRRG